MDRAQFQEVLEQIDERAAAGDVAGVRMVAKAWLMALKSLGPEEQRAPSPLGGKPGRPLRITNDQIVDAVREHMTKGHSYQAIAKKLQIDPSTLSRRIRKLPVSVQRELGQLHK